MPDSTTPELRLLLIQAALFFALLFAASISDIRRRIIPNTICALIGVVGLFPFSPTRLLGLLVALPMLIMATARQGSIGGGDIKLTAAAGTLLGLNAGFLGLSLGLSIMLLFHGARCLYIKLHSCGNPLPKTVPLVPFLSLGFLISYLLH